MVECMLDSNDQFHMYQFQKKPDEDLDILLANCQPVIKELLCY